MWLQSDGQSPWLANGIAGLISKSRNTIRLDGWPNARIVRSGVKGPH